MAGPVGVEKLAARLVDALIGVRAEVVALRLEQIGRQPPATIAVVKIERGGKSRRGNALARSGGNDRAPALLALLDFAAEKIVQETAADIRAGSFAPTSGFACRGCAYRMICPEHESHT